MTPGTKNALTFFAWFAVTAAVVGALAFLVLIPYMRRDIGPDPIAEMRLFQVAKAYLFYCRSTNPPRAFPAQAGDSAHAVALLFAKEYKLVEANNWLVDEDPALMGREIPRSLVTEDLNDMNLDLNFARLPLGIELAANVSMSAPATTPIAWTRGLQPDGKWSPNSPFAGLGGYMAFLDGHVTWYTELGGKKGTPLVKYGTAQPTNDIREALPPGAVILPANPTQAIGTVAAPPP